MSASVSPTDTVDQPRPDLPPQGPAMMNQSQTCLSSPRMQEALATLFFEGADLASQADQVERQLGLAMLALAWEFNSALSMAGPSASRARQVVASSLAVEIPYSFCVGSGAQTGVAGRSVRPHTKPRV